MHQVDSDFATDVSDDAGQRIPLGWGKLGIKQASQGGERQPIVSMYALALAVLSGAYAWSNSTVTAEKTYFTTYCPSPTTFAYGSSTYTITEATTLTIEDCSCTKSKSTEATATSAPAVANGAAAQGAAAAAGVAAAVAYLI